MVKLLASMRPLQLPFVHLDNVTKPPNKRSINMKSNYNTNDKVIVNDGIRRPFQATVLNADPRNTAQYEVKDEMDRTWVVHWAYLRSSDI